MDVNTTITDEIKWDLEGSGEMSAVIESGKISKLKFCLTGCSPDECFKIVDETHLRNIHKALTGLFMHLDKRRNVQQVKKGPNTEEANTDTQGIA